MGVALKIPGMQQNIVRKKYCQKQCRLDRLCEIKQRQIGKELEEDLKAFYDQNKLVPKELHTFQEKLIGNKVTEPLLKPELHEDKIGIISEL